MIQRCVNVTLWLKASNTPMPDSLHVIATPVPELLNQCSLALYMEIPHFRKAVEASTLAYYYDLFFIVDGLISVYTRNAPQLRGVYSVLRTSVSRM